MLNFNVCVWGGDYFYVVVFIAIFSNSELNCQTNRIGKNIFIDNILTRIFSYSILKVNPVADFGGGGALGASAPPAESMVKKS